MKDIDSNQNWLAWDLRPLGKRRRVEGEEGKGSLPELPKGSCTVNSSTGSKTTAAFHPWTLSLDESFSVHHKGRGVLGMANKGRHSNGSQFYITLQPAPYLDKKYVAFGYVRMGGTEQSLQAPLPSWTGSILQNVCWEFVLSRSIYRAGPVKIFRFSGMQ